ILDSVNHPILKTMVFRERERLLRGETTAVNDWDKAVVEFVKHDDRGDREDMLKDPDFRERLFSSIQLILRDYPDWFRDNSRNLPKRLTTSNTAGKPTSHDRLARAKTLIMLAEEAKWVVENYAKELKSENLVEKLEAAKQDRRSRDARISPDTNFKDVNTVVDNRYQTIAARGGFTGKEMGLSVLKFVATISAGVNVMNSFRDSGWKHLDQGIDAAIKNPLIYANIGIVYGINRYREDPRVAQLATVSPGRRIEIMTHVSLDSLARKYGKDWVQSFIATPPEWEAMRHIKPKDARKLVEKANERARKNKGQKPMIKKTDLEGKIPANIFGQLPDEGNDLKRFAFYSKFLTSESIDITQLHEHCRRW
ncbi:MAG: hypothetical protein V1908_01835, partial [Candidatus Peregrinibacteria bacterium]